MVKKILITGISGFIGRHFTRSIAAKKNLEIHALVRPQTASSRLAEFDDQIVFHQIDLADILALRAFLQENTFDQIYHIGALRGGRNFSRQEFFDANVNATEQIALSAKEKKSDLIYCSSVGVFGAIPLELPANNSTRRQEDNFYHYTKIRSEAIIQNLVLYGLKAVIIRPAISYGAGDYGFPYTLVKLVAKKLMFLPDKPVMIHLTNVEYLASVFQYFTDHDLKPGTAYNVADIEPVYLKDLVDFINTELRKKPYPHRKTIDYKYFAFGEKIARFLRNELWISRFELISKSWYYDIQNTRKDLGIKPPQTIPTFKNVANWYKTGKE